MARALERLEKLIRGAESVGMVIAGIAFACMVLTTAIDVVLRYVFNSPLIWAFPVITNYLIVLLYFCGVSATQRHRHHVGIELLTTRLPPRVRALTATVAEAAMLGFCALVAYCGAGLFWGAWIHDDVLPGVIAWPRWPSYLLVPLGFGLISLRLLVQMLQDFLIATGAEGSPPPESPELSAFE